MMNLVVYLGAPVVTLVITAAAVRLYCRMAREAR